MRIMDKSLDNKGRWRNVIISFRMSPQERDDLNVRVKLSGLHNKTPVGARCYSSAEHKSLQGFKESNDRNFGRVKADKQRCGY